MEALIGVFCILLVPGAIGFGIGWSMRGRRVASEMTGTFRRHADWLVEQLDQEPILGTLSADQRQHIREKYRNAPRSRNEPASPPDVTAPPDANPAGGQSYASWLVEEVDRDPMLAVLTTFQRRELRRHYAAIAAPTHPEVPVAAPAPTRVPEPTPAVAPASSPAIANSAPAPTPARTATPEPVRIPQSIAAPTSPPPQPARPARQPIEWDAAVLMLYLGAFLVVAAGLVYASYNWATFGPWQKLSLLMATTVAFAGAGWFLLGKERVRQAAETFVVIGALLVPANAIAAWSVFDQEDTRTAVIVLLGSLATALLYAVFSIRPGGKLYNYGAAIAGYLALAAVLPAFGALPNWGTVPVLLATAVVPDLANRAGSRWGHLRKPLHHVSIGALVLAFAGGLGDGSSGVTWLAPAVLAAITISLARMTVRDRLELAGVAATFTGIAVIPTALFDLDVQSPAAWSVASLATAYAIIPLAEWINRRFGLSQVRATLHGQATAGFLVAATIGPFHAEWLGALALALAVAGTALISRLRDERWWLLATGAYAAACWMSLPGAADRDWSGLAYLRWAIPFPVILAAAAFALDRWSRRAEIHLWGAPLWTVAGVHAVLVSVNLPPELDGFESFPAGTAAVAFGLYAITALAAAWSTGLAWARLGYGIWAMLAIGVVIWDLPLHLADRALVMLVATLGIAALSVDGIDLFRGRFRTVEPLWRPGARTRDRLDLPVFGTAALGALLVMLAYTAAYILDLGDPFGTGQPDIRWTWIAYLTVYAGVAAIAFFVGYWRGKSAGEQDPVNQALPAVVLGAGFAAAALLLRTVTTDAWAWSLAGIGVASLLNGWGFLQRQQPTANGFLLPMARRAELTGIALGAVAIAANLLVAFDPDTNANPWLQVAVYAMLAAAVTALGYRYPEPAASDHALLDSVQRWLPVRSLLLSGIAAVTLTRIFTDDAMTWSRIGICTGAALFAVARFRDASRIGNGFARRLATLASLLGLALLAVSVIANLGLAFDARDVNTLAQAAIYGVVGLTFTGLAARNGQRWFTLAAIASLAMAIAFAADGLGDGEIAVPASLVAFAWLVAGASFPMARTERWRAHQAAARLGALGSGGFAVILAGYQAEPVDVSSRAWQVVIFTLVSLAGLLAVDAVARRDRVRGIAASAIAMLALLLQIGVESPANIQAYTAPVGLYLLALGYVERRQRSARDILLGMGSGLLLVPPLLAAQADGDFTQLLVGAGIALALFVAGAIFQLRVPIAAGVFAISLIALRMLVDAAIALPSWVTLLLGGLVLLTGGTILLSWKERFRATLDRLQQGWQEMG